MRGPLSFSFFPFFLLRHSFCRSADTCGVPTGGGLQTERRLVRLPFSPPIKCPAPRPVSRYRNLTLPSSKLTWSWFCHSLQTLLVLLNFTSFAVSMPNYRGPHHTPHPNSHCCNGFTVTFRGVSHSPFALFSDLFFFSFVLLFAMAFATHRKTWIRDIKRRHSVQTNDIKMRYINILLRILSKSISYCSKFVS